MSVLQEEDLIVLTGSIWEALLGREVRRVDGSPDDPTVTMLTACVAITGEWRGTVEIVLPIATAVRCAADMFGLGDGAVEDHLVDDAIGELANIAAGNLKGMIAENTRLGLPTIVRGRDVQVSVSGAHVVCEASFESDDLPFRVVVRSPVDLPAVGWRN